jgi:vacuolar-type H+-ATPase subunit E/Vma4
MNVATLRTAVLEQAEAEAHAVLAEAESRALAEVDRARSEADTLLERGRIEGEIAGELETSRDRALAHRQARRLVLEARRDVYEEFRRRAHAAALALREGEGYGALLDRLRQAACDQLGDEVELEIDPPDAGGVRARAGRRRVDYTLPTLADRCIAALGGRLEGLWR